MLHRRASRLLLILAPIIALAACDQVASIWERVKGAAGEAQTEGPIPLEEASLEARAVAGVVRPASEMAALLEVEPVMIAPGQIVVGAQVEQQLDESANALGFTRSMVSRLRTEGADALQELPQNMMAQVRQRAELTASVAAEQAATDVLRRLNLPGEIEVRPGGVVTINLRPTDGVSPTSFQRFAQEGAAAQTTPPTTGDLPTSGAETAPEAVEWTGAACPRLVNVQQLEQDVELATRCAIARLEASGQFEYVDPNFIATVDMDRLPWPQQQQQQRPPQGQQKTGGQTTTPTQPTQQGVTLPNDPLEPMQWHYRARGTAQGQSPGGAGFESFWVNARQVGSRNIRVAVVDTGLDTRHPEVQGNPNVVQGVDLIANIERAGDTDGADGDAYDAGDRCGSATENSYHGTHVAGTIGAVRTNDRVGVAGGAWNVTIVPVRVLGRCGGELADIASGIRWAAGVSPAVLSGNRQLINGNPADIINLSLSVGVACPQSMQSAIDAAVARGAVVVVAAGNKANQTRNYAPANCNNVIVVGAGDQRGGLTFYSNFGPEVDIMAPGGDIFADRDGDGRPDGVLSSRASATGCYDPANNSGAQTCYYTFLQGTSMAAPHVSAALALLAAQTGLRGRELENDLFTRGLSAVDPAMCRIECARNRNASAIPGDAVNCMRSCGRGMLDLAHAASQAPPQRQGAAGGSQQRRR
ncbi:MAG: S8 family serine peptidase [Hyphomonadaceae bacterium]